MGRKCNFVLRNFFTFDVEKNLSECKICKLTFRGNYVCNLKRHLEEKHKKEYNEETEGNATEEPEKKKKFSVIMGQEEVKNACVDLVTAAKMPFAVLDSKGFKTLTDQIFIGLDMPPVTSRNNINLIKEKYCKIKSDMIKMDTATRLNRGILCVNVQYIDNNEIRVRTLGLIELKKSHTSKYISKEVESILSEFGISKDQIFTVTTDNGRNMVKAVELLNNCETDDEDEDGEKEDFDDEGMLKNLKLHSTKSIKCAAHTLQLAVKDFLQRLESVDYIDKARRIVKLLRTPAYRYLITDEFLPQPVLDVATRWSSTYSMLCKLQHFEEFCKKRLKSSFKLKINEWSDMKRLISTMEPAYLATVKLQSTQLFMGDFYKLWLELKLTVDAMNTHESKILSECILEREKSLLACDVVTCSIYLDPRIRRVLLKNPTRLVLSRAQLKQLFLKLIHLQQPTKAEAQANLGASEKSTLSQNSKTSLLDDFLQLIDVASGDETDEPPKQLKKGYAEIEGYSPKPISLTSNIIEYWEDKRYEYPSLYQLAKIVHAVPATQVSVERAFPALKIILTDQRCNTAEESLAKLPFVKLNNT